MSWLWWFLWGWAFRDGRFWRQYQVTSFTLSGVGALHPGVVVLVRRKARELWLPSAAEPQPLQEIHRLLDSGLLVPKGTKGTFDVKRLQDSSPGRYGKVTPAASFSLSEVAEDPVAVLMRTDNLTESDAEHLPEPNLDEIEFLPSKPAA